jgi:hypothetical protein
VMPRSGGAGACGRVCTFSSSVLSAKFQNLIVIFTSLEVLYVSVKKEHGVACTSGGRARVA